MKITICIDIGNTYSIDSKVTDIEGDPSLADKLKDAIVTALRSETLLPINGEIVPFVRGHENPDDRLDYTLSQYLKVDWT